MTELRPPRHRGLFWFAMLAAVAIVISGGAMALIAYQATSGPSGAVKGYFAALSRSNAAQALGFGSLPAGPHTLLTSTVLREQQRIAPISDVSVIATERHGKTATVTVQYRLGFADGPQQAVDTVQVIKHGRSWRLARTAVATSLRLNQALNRATILGAGIPEGTVLLFPGALPITFDSPYLGLDPGTSSVRLSDPAETQMTVDLTAAGHDQIVAALRTAVSACLAGGAKADPRCPLPSDRYVPGSLRAKMAATALSKLTVTITNDPDGVIEIHARDVAVTGRYERLNFNNIRVPGSGTVKLDVEATAYAVSPLVLTWAGGS